MSSRSFYGFCAVALLTAVWVGFHTAAAKAAPPPEMYQAYSFDIDEIIRSLEVVFNWASRECIIDGASRCHEYIVDGKDEGFTACLMDFFRRKKGQC